MLFNKLHQDTMDNTDITPCNVKLVKEKKNQSK